MARRGDGSGGNGRPVDDGPAYKRLGDRLLEICEEVVYVGIAAALVVTAGVLLVVAGGHVVTLVTSGGQDAAIEVLDALLLIFIVVELLFAVRATVTRRELVAEPFLLVGIIAAVKEIVVLSVKAAESAGTGREFTDQITEVAVLGGLVLSLGITAWLLRLKEREPAEADADRPDGPAARRPAAARERSSGPSSPE